MKRLFFALWPDDGVRARLAEQAGLLPITTGRRVPPENFHITLVFLGNVEEQAIPGLADSAAGLRIPGFSLQIERCGWWKRAKVAWLAPAYTPAPLEELVGQINQFCVSAGLPIDKRDYSPHLTIARKVNRPVNNLCFDPIGWDVRDFCLVESVTHEHGVRYQVRQSWLLARNASRDGFYGIMSTPDN